MKLRILLSLVVISLAAAPAVSAKGGEKSEAIAGAAADVPIPEKPEDLWVQIDAQRKALADAVTAAQADAASKAAALLQSYVRAIPEKYTEIPALKRKSVHHESKTAARLLEDLREAMDQKNAAQAALVLNQIDGVLKFIKDTVAPPPVKK